MEVFMATIKEIAEIVGVSSAAVSRVLNYDEGISVSAETRAAIFAAAEKWDIKRESFSQNRKCRASVLHRSGR